MDFETPKTVFRVSIDDIQNNSELLAITIEQNSKRSDWLKFSALIIQSFQCVKNSNLKAFKFYEYFGVFSRIKNIFKAYAERNNFDLL